MRLVAHHNRRTFVLRNLLQVLAIHAVALVGGPLLFSWDALALAAATLFLFGYPMGIFHHMLLTHRSFKCARWVERLGALLGTLTWRGPFAAPIRYVAMHRVHHRHSDTDLDPHSPVHGWFHALLGWFWNMPYGFVQPETYEQLAPDTARDRFLVFLDRHVDLVQGLWGAVCFALGGAVPMLSGGGFDPLHGLAFVVYGVFVRALLTIYLVNAVDLVNHTIGYRNYATRDTSTNSLLMALLHGGGAITWHNNHHAHMGYFTVRGRWWEFDLHHQLLRLLGLFGLVWDIKILDEVAGARVEADGGEPTLDLEEVRA